MFIWDVSWGIYWSFYKIGKWRKWSKYTESELKSDDNVFERIWGCNKTVSTILTMFIPTSINYITVLYLPVRMCYLFPLSCCVYGAMIFMMPNDVVLIKSGLVWLNAIIAAVWGLYFGIMVKSLKTSDVNRQRDLLPCNSNADTFTDTFTFGIKVLDIILYMIINIAWVLNIITYHGKCILFFYLF